MAAPPEGISIIQIASIVIAGIVLAALTAFGRMLMSVRDNIKTMQITLTGLGEAKDNFEKHERSDNHVSMRDFQRLENQLTFFNQKLDRSDEKRDSATRQILEALDRRRPDRS